MTRNPRIASNSQAKKLTDTQLAILSSAARHEEGIASLPDRLKGQAAQRAGGVLIERGLMREIRAKAGRPAWRTDVDARSFSLQITKAGRQAIDARRDAEIDSGAAGVEAERLLGAEASANAAAIASISRAPACRAPGALPRPGTKQALIVDMLASPGGATIADLRKATGWLPHTTRAALTGLRKKGYAIERMSGERQEPSAYRIIAPAQVAA
jgi:hypothetical protein